jgi:enterochelin esterase family protein
VAGDADAAAVTGAETGPTVDDVSMTFRVADASRALAGVRLQQLARIPGDQLDFRRADGGWKLVLPRPPVSRLEYLLELNYAGGGSKVVTDPANPRQAPGAFGPKSVLEFPGYAPPGWLAAPADPGTRRALEVRAPALDEPVGVMLWAPSGTADDEPLPLLLVNDGPEYDSLASLTQYLGAGIAGGCLPRLRAALLSPGPRNSWYSASSRYARALTGQVIPALAAATATTAWIGMGTSLGALAMLHAHCRYPGVIGGLFLQSGSFFTPPLDGQERRFPYFRRITAFTAALAGGSVAGDPVPVVMTCGSIEENVENNRLTRRLLASAGYPAALHEVADLHNFTAWRNAFHPHLAVLIAAAVS